MNKTYMSKKGAKTSADKNTATATEKISRDLLESIHLLEIIQDYSQNNSKLDTLANLAINNITRAFSDLQELRRSI